MATLLAALALAAGAEPVRVGRAVVELPPGPGWQSRPLVLADVGITGGVDGRMDVAGAVFWLTSPRGTVDAVLAIEGSKESYAGRLQWNADCEGQESNESTYVRNRWRNLWRETHDDCLVVEGPTDLGATFPIWLPEAALAMGPTAALLRGPGYLYRARIARNGTFIAAWMLVRQSFRGSPQPLSVELGPARLPAPVVQWGTELSAALLSSTLSMSGKVTVPRIDMDAAIDAKQPPAPTNDGAPHAWYQPLPRLPRDTPDGRYEASLQATVGIDGFVRDARVVRSTGRPDLDQALLGALEAYRFTPDHVHGKPREVTVTLPFSIRVE